MDAQKTVPPVARIAQLLPPSEHSDVARYERELLQNPALAESTLRELPPGEEPKRVTIRTDPHSLDVAIIKALALAVQGVEARIELTEGKHAE